MKRATNPPASLFDGHRSWGGVCVDPLGKQPMRYSVFNLFSEPTKAAFLGDAERSVSETPVTTDPEKMTPKEVEAARTATAGQRVGNPHSRLRV